MRASVAAVWYHWQPLPNAGKFMVIFDTYSPKNKWKQVQECMVSAMVERLDLVWGRIGSIPNSRKFRKNWKFEYQPPWFEPHKAPACEFRLGASWRQVGTD
jgi:hypothetical protein